MGIKKLTQVFVRGLVVLLPVVLSVYIVVWLVEGMSRVFDSVLFWLDLGEFKIPGLTTGIGLLAIFAVGLIAPVRPVAALLGLLERQILKVPLLRSIFSAIQDLVSYFGRPTRGSESRQVVMVEFPPDGRRMVGLLTRANTRGLPEALSEGEPRVAVYLPMSYAVGGMTIFVPKAWVKPLDIPVDQVMRLALTAWIRKEDEGV